MEKVCDKVRLLNVSCHFPAILQAQFELKVKKKVNISSYNIDTCCL